MNWARRGGLGEPAGGTEGAVDLIGGDMQEAENLLAGAPEPGPILTGASEQVEGAHHVGLDEGGRTLDRAVHMALGREVDHGVHPVVAEQASHQVAVTDIAGDEDMPGVTPQRGQGVRIAGVGELVQIDDLDIRLGNEGMDEIGADKAGAAGHQDALHGRFRREFRRRSRACRRLGGRNRRRSARSPPAPVWPAPPPPDRRRRAPTNPRLRRGCRASAWCR